MIRIEIVMTILLGSICLVLYLISKTLTLKKDGDGGTFLPPKTNPNKREFEAYALHYTVVWIAAFAVVIVFQMYNSFDENSYMALCVSLALPFLLQPFIYPLKSERGIPLMERYSFKANAWLAIFSFIGNYWYTHYFYSVLKASYSFPSHRLNNVPIALYFATHFYFVTYHTFSNLILRKIETRYEAGALRTLFFWTAVLAFSYFTAFMETLTISSFPYYSFEDRFLAYTLGSAFYGLYFLVSFPVFYRLDERLSLPPGEGHLSAGVKGEREERAVPYTVFQTVMEAMGCSMLVLLLLDFARLVCGITLNIPGTLYYVFKP